MFILQLANFVINWEDASIGIVKGDTQEQKADFAIALEVMVEAGGYTGYIAEVKRSFDGGNRSVLALLISEL